MIFEQAWNKLVDFYRNNEHYFFHEHDMRCLLYHFCAQQLGDNNLYILHSEYSPQLSNHRFDLILSEGESGGVVVELKCVPHSSVGVHQEKVDADLEKLRYAINEDKFAFGFFCILDEHRKICVPDQVEEPNIIVKKFYPERNRLT